MSIRNKILALVLSCVIGIMSFGALVVYKQQKEWIQKEAEFFGKDTGNEALKSLYSLMYASERYGGAKRAILDQYKSNSSVVTVRVFRSPLLEAQYGPTPADGSPKSNFENELFGVKKPLARLGEDKNTVEIALPMLAEGGECLRCHVKAAEGDLLGGLYLQVRLDGFGDKIKKDRREILMITVAFLAFIVMFITSMLRRLVGAPIESVVEVADKIAKGQISNLELKPSNDEMGRLVAGFSKMVESLSEVSTSARAMASGDLSQNITQTGELADSFNDMVKSLSSIVQRIRMSSDTLGKALARIAEIARTQSEGAEDQIREVAVLQSTMNELSQSAANAAGQSDAMFEMAQNSLKSAQTGRQAAKAGSDTMDHIATGMDETAGKAEELKEKTQQIGKVLEIINDIAMETKILSVNASIEASKAGEMGKGFTVVAGEIAKLAENVVQSTSSIKEINDEIQSFSDGLLTTIDRTAKSAHTGVETMKKMDEALEKILDAANQTAQAAKNISTISRAQSEKNRGVLQQMEGISVKANDLSRAAQNTADEAVQIKMQFESLEAEVARFRVTPPDAAKGAPAAKSAGAPAPAGKVPTSRLAARRAAAQKGGGEGGESAKL